MSLLSIDSILKEMEYYEENSYDFDDFLNRTDSLLEACAITESDSEIYDKITKRLKLDILVVERFVEVNDC